MEEIHRFREELLASVEGLTDEQLNEIVAVDRWTIMQVLEHLYLLERSVTKGIEKELQNEESQPASEKPIHLTMSRKSKVKAPSFSVPTSSFISLEEMKKKLAASREALLTVIAGVEESVLESKSFKHMIFGQMTLKQWVEFLGYHENRHMQQIEELKNEIIR